MSDVWSGQEASRPYHPASMHFPLMEGEDFKALTRDIAENGQQEAIWLHPDGSILDGRNRHRACLELGVQPAFSVWNDTGSPLAFVVSLNLHRRHLTASQRAAIAVELLPALEAEAKERQRSARVDIEVGNNLPSSMSSAGKAAQQAAQLLDTNTQYVQIAKALRDEAPDLLAEVRSGQKSLAAARWELKKRERQENPPLPTEGKYRVFYADPPWQYSRAELDGYGHTRRHYPSMSIDELCQMGHDIQRISEEDAVLFLWVTSPMLPHGFKVIEAWGFTYKTSFVWDKVRHNFGHYNSVRHELLLIATRGSCTPDDKTLIDSVQTIERSEEHSEKPEEFRKIIEGMYTHGRRIELFARTAAASWDTWGNEPGQHDAD